MIIIAVDPGLVSGLAVWSSDAVRKVTTSEIPYQEIGQTVEAQLLAAKNMRGHTLELACERYTMKTGVKTAQPEALKTMGILEFLAQRYNVKLSFYLPETCKGTMKNPRLKDVDWYRATKDGHANDGARVLGTHLFNQFPDIAGRLFGL